MDAHAGRAEQQAWGLAVVAAAIALAYGVLAGWMDAAAPPAAGSFCTALASGQLDVTQFTQDMVTAFRAACAG
jgi:hypothetical protein